MLRITFLVMSFVALTLTGASAKSVPAEFMKLGRGVDKVELVDDTGKTVHWSELKGSPRAVFFGFTRCPVICPVTVWELGAALDKLGADAGKIQVTFVSLDPTRDTPDVLKNYFSPLKGRVRGYGGAEKNIDKIAKSFDVVHRKVPTTGDDYTMDHTAAVFLLNKQGAVIDTLAYGTPQDVIIERLRTLAAAK